ncbi:MAG TPA: FAD-binding protein, partial [Acidimicrobiales bacterium]
MPRPLLSEALRGHGAFLRDATGERFVDELKPRDVVSRAMAARMAEQGVDHLWLDATGLEDFDRRFPTITASMRAAGLDPTKEWLPVAPAAHYCIGGVLTDLDGASGLPGLWAAGEAACSGVHGANRLGSNSLLEGMVFAARVVEAILDGKERGESTGALRALDGPLLDWTGQDDAPPGVHETADAAKVRDLLQTAMTHNAGVRRDAASLAEAQRVLREAGALLEGEDTRAEAEVRNLLTVGDALVEVATRREESRGCHTRSDFPETSPALRRRLVIW